MTDELVMLAEWQNEYGSDYLILMREWAGGEKMSSGLELFLLRRDLVFLFASYTKCTISFTVSRMSRIRFQGSFYKEILVAA